MPACPARARQAGLREDTRVSEDLRIGTQIGEYRIESLLGRGGMSVVYLAEHVRLKRKAALKVLSPELAEDPTFRQRFVSEWERLAGIDHPNIIPIFEAGEANGLLYIAMRYVETTDLRGLIQQEGRLDPARAVGLIAQVAGALDAAHAKSLVHRDVKPANILLALGAGPEGSDHAYLADFGLTKHTDSRSGLTKTGHFMGTIDYVAPEQIAGKGVDGRTDQYALGCVLYECLTGKVPFPREEDTAALFAHLQDPPPKPSAVVPELPPEIDDVIAKSMAKEKEERYASCTELARAARMALHLGQAAVPVKQIPPIMPETVLAPAPEPIPATTPPPPVPEPTRAAPAPEPARSNGGGRGKLVAIVGGVLIATVAAVFALTQLGGGGGGGGGATSPSTQPSVEPSLGPGVLEVLVQDGFDDPSAGWETRTSRGIERTLTPEGTYRFSVTAGAPPAAFATALGGVGGLGGIRASDMSVQVTATVVATGSGKAAPLYGVACRANGDSVYYLYVAADGRWDIQKVFNTSDFRHLDQGTEPAIAGATTFDIEGRCVGGADGTAVTITLIVNGIQVTSVTDADQPIPDGVAGISLAGPPGLVVDFDDFVYEKLAPL